MAYQRYSFQVILGALLASAVLASSVAANMVSPGFEQGPSAASISFSPTDANGLGWIASNTDGERILTTVSKPAAEGDYYASLLQNGGAYNGDPLGIGNFGSTGFDRIYATTSATPSTTYDLTFQHAGDDRFGYLAGTSVIEIVDADLNTLIKQSFLTTPSLFNWQTGTVSFTTGPTTSNIAIAFTVMGTENTSGVFDDIQLRVVPEPATCALLIVSMFALGISRRHR